MAEMTYREAVVKALADELASDPDVIFFGEDVAEAGGVFKVTPGLYERFGGDRVRDTPISEQAIIGTALGAAITGLRPVAELMFADFVPVALDQIANQVAKYRYMSGGQFIVPLTIRAAQGGGNGFGTQHSQCAESWLMSFPGIKVVSPSTPVDAYGLLRGAIRENNPVFVLEHKGLYNLKGEVPDDTQPMKLGEAKVVRAGSHVTVVASQLMLHRSLEAAANLAKEGIECEVIDIRSFVPLDKATILNSLAKTNRLVIVEEAPHQAGWGGDIASLAADEGVYWLAAPVKRVNMGGALIAYSPPLEDEVLPNVGRITQAIRAVLAD
ncbi:MAG: alpha-ketoacid dehydrogenase subunit beta [Chloroflexi bacterium]|uniref:alpha-ketoacid dehydrogenase subunit beta n=1 Tax=Candidatus Flexifilum breve TaxID=3140694 RepID=UPI0031362A1D|nr:alpha-ketoacid dehydrogenase subunit beta [Chloroflexota bacterium]